MIAKLGSLLNRSAARWVPDPFVLALLLTALVTVLGAVRLGGAPPAEGTVAWVLFEGWIAGFTGKAGLAFALQMCLVLVTGHALALSPPIQKGIQRLAGLPQSAAAATMLVAVVACLAAVVHWGLGAIVGALVAREIGRHAESRGLRLHYPLLGGAAYAGLAVWHGGLSGSAPLKAAEAGNFVEAIAGVIPVSETLLAPLNLAVTGGLCVLIPLVFRWMSPDNVDERVGPDTAALAELPSREMQEVDSIPAWLQESPGVGRVVGGVGVLVLAFALGAGRLTFNLNFVNLLFLFLGIFCQGGLRHYVAAVADGAKGAGGIILQFPFYFGILGLMKASGMIEWISEGFVAIATQQTFPVFAFLSAGLVNLLVPSGGGQWAVQGEVLLSAGAALEVPRGVTVLAFSYGDAWTNMLQPFWALPLLGIMGLKAKEIIGYTAVVFFVMLLFVPLLLLTLG